MKMERRNKTSHPDHRQEKNGPKSWEIFRIMALTSVKTPAAETADH